MFFFPDILVFPLPRMFGLGCLGVKSDYDDLKRRWFVLGHEDGHDDGLGLPSCRLPPKPLHLKSGLLRPSQTFPSTP